MPWTSKDAGRHTKKADTPKKARQWSDVSNAVRTRELEKGASEDEADARAVRIANGVVKKNRGK